MECCSTCLPEAKPKVLLESPARGLPARGYRGGLSQCWRMPRSRGLSGLIAAPGSQGADLPPIWSSGQALDPVSSPQASRHSCPGPATLATLSGAHSSSQSPALLMPPSPWWSLQNSFQCLCYLFGLPLPFGNISCKYGWNKGQKWQGPNRNRRD